MGEFCRICENTVNINLMSQKAQQQFTELTGIEPTPFLWICKFCLLSLESATRFRSYALETDCKLKLNEVVHTKPNLSISSQIYALSNQSANFIEIGPTTKLEPETDTSQDHFFEEAYPDLMDETNEEEDDAQDFFEVIEPPQSKQKKVWGNCYKCRETKLNRKCKKACTDCCKPICDEHSEKFIKCSNCDTLTGLEVEYSSTDKPRDPNRRMKHLGNCYSCRDLRRKYRKTRRGCNRCKRPICSEHSIKFAKCHNCLSNGAPVEIITTKIEPN